MFNAICYLVVRFKGFLKSEAGVTTIEYGILAAGLAVIIGFLVADDGKFSSTLSSIFDTILEQLPQADSSSGTPQ
ncbi:MAG: Flp family type IVb pilin [Deltaproteobacteria bacterium]|jgi:pilus assembly protein Flp/PilA|nr:Flp family type IVb pilin [Deltaproteobacteria bacterium]